MTNTTMDKTTELAQSEPETAASSPRKKIIAATVLAVIVAAAGGWYLYSQGYETTDDAQIDGHLDQIAPRITGTIAHVYVNDNQMVEAGTPLVDLDTHDEEIALAQARAQYDQAVAQLKAQRPSVAITAAENRATSITSDLQVTQARAAFDATARDLESASARLADSEANHTRDAAQLKRYEELFSKNEVSRQDYERIVASARSATANVDAARASVASTAKLLDQRKAEVDAQIARRAQVLSTNPQQLEIRSAQVSTAEANVEAASAQLQKATLNLAYCHLTSPVRGIVTQRSAETGNRATEGQPLMMVVESGDTWITANFKETQMRRMHHGQAVTVHVDALGRDLEGTVDGIPAVTGARSSVLPPENATGNYIKVVQRMPVRIRVHGSQDVTEALRPGMSVEAKVWLR